MGRLAVSRAGRTMPGPATPKPRTLHGRLRCCLDRWTMMESVTGSPVADASRQAEITATSSCSLAAGSSRATMNAILRSHPVGGSADRSGVEGSGVRLASPRSPVMAPAELRRFGHGISPVAGGWRRHELALHSH